MRLLSSRWLRFAVGLNITAVCLWLALRKAHLDGVARVVGRVEWAWLGIALAALGVGYAVRIYRWWWMLRLGNPTLPLRACVWPLIVGYAVNNILPFRAGDVLRAVGFREQLGTPIVRLVGSLLIERILDLTILLLFLVIGVAALGSTGIPPVYIRTTVLVAGVAVTGWVLLLSLANRSETILLRICRLKFLIALGWASRAEQHLRQLLVALRIVRAPGHALKLLAMSAAIWVCEGGIFAAVANGLHYDGRAFGPWFGLATGSLSTLIPSSPGYVGTFDFFTISGLAAYGATASVASATAFMVHGVLWLPPTAAGLAYLLWTNLRRPGSRLIPGPIPEQERT